MMHVHGARVQRQLEALRRFPLGELVAVAVDTGKSSAIALVADFTGERLCPPITFDLTRDGLARLSGRVAAAIADRPVGVVRLGVEASGYHLPLLAPGMLPSSWELVELNPAHVARQRKANGQRGVKTDVNDATAIFDLLVAGRGSPITRTQVLELLDAWATHRRRQVEWRRAVGNHLLSQLHRSFPGADRCVCTSCWPPRSGGWSPPSSPTRPGWHGWARPGSVPSRPDVTSGWTGARPSSSSLPPDRPSPHRTRRWRGWP